MNGVSKKQSSIMLENLRGTHFIDPEDGEYMETMKKRKKIGEQ